MSTDLPSLYDRLTPIFRDVFDDDSIVLRADLTAADVENWDSITHINMIVAVERAFHVRFTTAEVAALNNVGELVALIEKKTA